MARYAVWDLLDSSRDFRVGKRRRTNEAGSIKAAGNEAQKPIKRLSLTYSNTRPPGGGAFRIMRTKLIAPKGRSNDSTDQAVSWGVKAVGAHDSKLKGEGVTVAILDTGITTRYK